MDVIIPVLSILLHTNVFALIFVQFIEPRQLILLFDEFFPTCNGYDDVLVLLMLTKWYVT